jgi:hypothetical protein
MRTVSLIWSAARHKNVRFKSSVDTAIEFRQCPILISILQSPGVEAAFSLTDATSQYLAKIAILLDSGKLRPRLR